MNTLKEIANNILGGILGAVGIRYYIREEPLVIDTTVEETDQEALYRKQREYMRTNHW